jgi:hypothetical protein
VSGNSRDPLTDTVNGHDEGFFNSATFDSRKSRPLAVSLPIQGEHKTMASESCGDIEGGIIQAVREQINGAKLQVITGAFAGLTATDAELIGRLIRGLRNRRRLIANKSDFRHDELYTKLVEEVGWIVACEEAPRHSGKVGEMVRGAELKAMEARAREYAARFL